MNKMKEKMQKIIEIIKNNKKLSIVILGALVILVLGLVLYLSKNTLASPEDSDSFTINCPEIANKNSKIECYLSLNSATFSTQGITASYYVTDGMKFVNFIPEDGASDFIEQNSEGFVLVNFSGIMGSKLIGTVEFTIPEFASGNDIYKVELLNAIIGDGGDESIVFNNVYDEIRISSDINTLDSLTLSTGTLNETFDKNNNQYTAIVDAEYVTINAIKTDENSNVNSNTNNINLHYGTNNVNVTVVSESGIENTYTIDIYRPYRFESDTYVYNSDDNYIYTGDDVLETEILSNIQLPTELTGDIEDNKFIISYGNEKLLEIDIINILFEDYSIINYYIWIGTKLSFSEFIDNLKLNNVSIKIFDDNNNEIIGGNIGNNYKMKVYYNRTLLDEYIILEEYLTINDYEVDDKNMIIKRVKNNIDYESLRFSITTSGRVTRKDKEGNNIPSFERIKTGDIIEIIMYKNTFNYTLSVLGDLTGDGIVNLGDVGLLYRYLKGKTELKNYQIAAGDVFNNGSIKVNDVSRIYRFHKGKVESLE